MYGIAREVEQRVVHPAHVPLEAKPDPSRIDRAGYAGERSGLFGDDLDVRMIRVDASVQLAEEFEGLQVLPPSMDIRDPLPRSSGVVEVEHGGHGIDPQAIDVVRRQPMLRRGGQKAPHLVTSIIEDQALPVGMKSEARIRMLEQMRPVELGQCKRILGKMRRNPVEKYADPGAVQLIDEKHEILWCSIAAGRGKEACRLVAPRTVKRVLHQGEKLDMGEPGAQHMRNQRFRHFGIAQKPTRVRRVTAPASEVHLVDRKWRVETYPLASGLHPVTVTPLVGQIPDHRPGQRRRLRTAGEGVSLLQNGTGVRGDGELVDVPRTGPIDCPFPNT